MVLAKHRMVKVVIPLFKPYIPKGVGKSLWNTLYSGNLSEGPKVKEFENKFKSTFGVTNAVATNSGTSALEIIYELLGLKKGDEVISTPLTCVATNLPIIRRGAKIVWADIKKDTLCIDPEDVKRKINSKTKAVIQVHLGGRKAQVKDIPIPIVSDACQALGIFTGDYTACSFQAIKAFTSGDGGMLVCDYTQAKKARLLRWYGIDRDRDIEEGWEKYKTRMMCFDIEFPGAKKNMNDISATLGLAGLNDYRNIYLYRRKLFNIYRKKLHNITRIKLLDSEENMYLHATVLVEERDNFAKMLYEEGIETNIIQVRNDKYKVFGEKVSLPVMDEIENRYLSLPLGTHLTEADVENICSIIKRGW